MQKVKCKVSSPTLWLSPLFLILLASLPVDSRTKRDSSSSTEPGMVRFLHPNSKLFLCLPPFSSVSVSEVFLLPLLIPKFVPYSFVGLLLFQLKQ